MIVKCHWFCSLHTLLEKLITFTVLISRDILVLPSNAWWYPSSDIFCCCCMRSLVSTLVIKLSVLYFWCRAGVKKKTPLETWVSWFTPRHYDSLAFPSLSRRFVEIALCRLISFNATNIIKLITINNVKRVRIYRNSACDCTNWVSFINANVKLPNWEIQQPQLCSKFFSAICCKFLIFFC